MGKLDKYIFWQIASAAFMTVALFVFVLVLGNVFKEVLGDLLAGRMSFGFFLKVVALIIPGVIPYSLPMGMLTGILLVFGRMSAQSEITAMKACGHSVYAMTAPVFLLSIMACVLSFFINFYYAPAADYAYKNAIRNVIRQNPMQFIKAGRFVKDFPGYVIFADKVGASQNELLGFRIWELDSAGKVRVSVRADKATASFDAEKDDIVMKLDSAAAEYSNADDPEILNKPLRSGKFKSSEIRLPLSKIIGDSNRAVKKPSRMTFDELVAALDTWHKIPLDSVPPQERERRAKIDRIEISMQIQKNFAMAFSIFSMVVLAVPLGIKASRSETFVNLAIAVGLAMSYYMATVFITWLENYPELRPDLLIWIPNFLFQGIGLVLLRRCAQH